MPDPWLIACRSGARRAPRCAALALIAAIAGCSAAPVTFDASTDVSTREGAAADAPACACAAGEFCCVDHCQPLGTTCGGADAASGDAPADAGDSACTPPGPGTAAPSGGFCDGSTAVVCDTSPRWTRQSCGATERCVQYTVQETDPAGVALREYPWAACVPAAALPCAFALVTDARPARWDPAQPPRCDANTGVRCLEAPLPRAPGGALVRGTTRGVQSVTACRADETCVLDAVGMQPSCVLRDARCTPGGPATYCEDATTLVDCTTGGTRSACTARDPTYRCVARADGSGGCAPATAVTCDPATYTAACVTPTVGQTCYATGRYVLSVDCGAAASCFDPRTGAFTAAPPCRCAVASARDVRCVGAAAESCDPAASASRCAGNVVHRCAAIGSTGGVYVDLDCATLGLVCRVGAGGVAGCASTIADDAGTTCSAGAGCDGDAMTGCCGSSGLDINGAVLNAPGVFFCAPGLPTSFPCGRLSTSMTAIHCRSTAGVQCAP